MNTVSLTTPPNRWFVYVAQTIFQKGLDGYGHKNCLTLEKQVGSFKSFKDAYNRMEEIGRDVIRVNKGVAGCKSRSKDYCIDYYIVPVPENDTLPKDSYTPAYRAIEIIATTYTLALSKK